MPVDLAKVVKDGNVAGPRVLEHLVDVVLNFEGDRHVAVFGHVAHQENRNAGGLG